MPAAPVSEVIRRFLFELPDFVDSVARLVDVLETVVTSRVVLV